MTDRRVARPLLLACLLVLAGCSNPFGPADTPTPDTPTPDPVASPTPTPTDERPGDATPRTDTPSEEDLPAGVSYEGIDDAEDLFGAHTRALERTGFVAVGNGSSVVQRSGILVDVESSQRNRVAPNGSVYEVRRDATAGPLKREEHAWSNGTIEYQQTQEDGETNYNASEPRPVAELAGSGLLGPYVRGGNFSVQEFQNDSEDRPLVVLATTDVANATVLERAITDDAEEVTSYEAILVVDWSGRIRSLDATVEYVIQGRTSTQELDYTLASVEGAEVESPDWLDDAREAANESAVDRTTVTRADDGR